MTNIIKVSLENEMDLVLAHRKSMKVAERLGLTIATQTTFATAVSEIARTVIEHTDNGELNICVEQYKQRYSLIASVAFENTIRFTNEDAGYYYAQKLVPEFRLIESETGNTIEMKIGMPRSLRLDPVKLATLVKYFEEEEPLNAYEEIKQRNYSLNKIAQEKEEELRQSKIIDEKKTEFISIASHEIKTPITIIKAYTQIALTLGDQCSEDVREFLTKVDFQTTKLLSLVQQLLDVSKMENGNFAYTKEPVSLNGFIIEMEAVLKNIVPHHQIIVNLSNDYTVFIDKIRMEQVFSNIIVNAAKYSDKHTDIIITGNVTQDGFVKIGFTDQGIGMTSGSMESIFKKFYRDKDVMTTHSGLGMGLYITSKIIRDHGGEIWAESTEGIGSTFYITIPVAE
ncbi:sensor histidine kinase [Taibaiella lutea]|uniref:histidine kinase n=1 Tax=Taibaiella lutea TaxID=2608001 RepID=A0A5M6CAT7_9BACT|nr:sensor histidine kinase [Taibaiella lutea]KAA5532287.1 sensor histidine kinase [Taibaiella lutea]